jgi:NTE family protein
MRSRLSASAFFAALGILFAGAPAVGAEPAPAAAPKARPRVGLVLSGGGARGIAHIGVIRVLEERRVPIDLITGTSMGSIIGGLYAAGYSPDEMESIVDGIDWADAFDDSPPRKERSFRRKEDDLGFLTAMKIGIQNGGIALPWGLVQGQKLNLILRRLFLPVAEVHDFDQLRIPFRCVSTDIVTGKAEVHANGDLATAIRASMSLPGVFAPVEVGEKLLVDGGISNNTPVDLALEMGADVLIVVDVGTPLAKREEINNAAAVISQMTGVMVVQTTERALALMRPGDILLRPDLAGVSTGSFEMGSEVAPRGEAVAREHLADLDRLAIPEAEHQVALARQRHGTYESPMVARVEVTNNSRLRDDVLAKRLETKAGEPLDPVQVEADIQEIYGLDSFERVDYALEREPEGVVLDIHAHEKSWGPHYLRVGLNLQENFENTSDYNLAFNYTLQPQNGLGGEWRNDIQLGSTLRLFSEMWQPLDETARFFVAPSFEFRRERFPIYDGDERTDEYMVRHTNAGIDLGRQLSNWGEVRLGFLFDFGHTRSVIGTTGPAPEHLRTGGFYLRFATDTLDNVHFPRSGSYSQWAYGVIRESLGAKEDFEIFQGQLAYAYTYRDNTVLLSLGSTISWNASQDVFDLARLGGLFSLSGLDKYQLAGRNAGVAGLRVYRRVAAPGALSFTYPLYAGLSIETGDTSQTRAELFEDVILSGAAFFGMETPLGPIYVAYGYAEGGSDAVYLYLGRTF